MSYDEPLPSFVDPQKEKNKAKKEKRKIKLKKVKKGRTRNVYT